MFSVLKETAASSSGYIRLEDLKPGRYEVLKFSLRESQFGKRVVIDIDGGWIFLPEKMYTKFNTEKSIAKLNKERYDFVFEGKSKRAPHAFMFTFEMHDSDATTTYANDEDSDDDENTHTDSDSNNNDEDEDDVVIKPSASKNNKRKSNRKSSGASKSRAGTAKKNKK